MRTTLLPLAMVFLMAACSKNVDHEVMKLAERKELPEGPRSSLLAYEHSLSIDVEEQRVTAVFKAGQLACQDAVEDACSLLESRIGSGRESNAFLKFRAKPSGIKRIIAALGKQGEITEQATTAEDLTVPISDAARKLAMLKDYRSKLDALRERASKDVDALIKVSKELAQVQSDLEEIEGKHAHLMRRVDTDILMVTIRSNQARAFWKPIGFALADFAGNLSQGIASAITGIAFLIPWTIILLLAAWTGKVFWRARKNAKQVA